MPLLPAIVLKDGYKADHRRQWPDGTTRVNSNFTPRQSRTDNDFVIFFGLQYFIKEYLINVFNKTFFSVPREAAVRQYARRINNYLGPNQVGTAHIAALHDLGYLPLRIKALPEGTKVPLQVPPFTIENTFEDNPEFSWLTNYVETLVSCTVWGPCTSATTAFQYRKTFDEYAKMTGSPLEFCQWQGHDFSFRGMFGLEAAVLSGSAHLLSFTGTDTIPAIDFLEQYYNADSDKELIGGSVAASEHAVMCAGGKATEAETYDRLISKVYPTGIVSIVSDTWDFWAVVTETLPALKDKIMARDGKLVIRPDSGEPVLIICGDPEAPAGSPARKGLIQCLWEIFGGTVNEKGFKVLDSHIGAIYGDSITVQRQLAILSSLKAQGFASCNVVLGIGLI
jgi:nicotinamide phosphoribosyltransferase